MRRCRYRVWEADQDAAQNQVTNGLTRVGEPTEAWAALTRLAVWCSA